MASTIDDEHIRHWHEHGYAVVEDFLTDEEVEGARRGMADCYPSREAVAADPEAHAATVEHPFALHEFPYRGEALNRLTFHPEIVRVVRDQLGTSDIRLATSVVWAKYGEAKGLDQSLHVDYANNTLVYPRDDGIYRQMPFILYLSDVTDALGPTQVVSQALTGTDVATVVTPTSADARVNPDAERYGWYRAERSMTVRAGSLLMYSMRTFHRGTKMDAPDGVRLSLHLVYRSAACQFMGWRVPARDAETEEMRRFLVTATPSQREMINFPAPDDPYWNEETIAGVAARYPDMDLTPYRNVRARAHQS